MDLSIDQGSVPCSPTRYHLCICPPVLCRQVNPPEQESAVATEGGLCAELIGHLCPVRDQAS